MVVAVNLGQVEVAIARLDGMLNCPLNFARLGKPSAQTDLRDLVAVIKGNVLE